MIYLFCYETAILHKIIRKCWVYDNIYLMRKEVSIAIPIRTLQNSVIFLSVFYVIRTVVTVQTMAGNVLLCSSFKTVKNLGQPN